MKSNKKPGQAKVWLIIWIFYTAINCSATGENPSIRLTPNRLRHPGRFIDYSNENEDLEKIPKPNVPAESRNKLLQNGFKENSLRNTNTISKINGLLNCWCDPQCLNMIFSDRSQNEDEGMARPAKLKKQPVIPVLPFNNFVYKKFNDYLITDEQLVQLLNQIATEDSSNNQTVINDHPVKNHEVRKTLHSKEKNPSLMEAILNPFFFKIFKNNRVANEKKKIESNKINNNIVSAERSDKTYSDINTKWNLLNNFVKHKLGSLSPSKGSTMKQDNILPDPSEPKQSNEIGENEDSFNTYDKNKFAVEYQEDEHVTAILKPVKLSELVKNDESFGLLLNETLLDFSSQVFNILQESDQSVPQEVDDEPNESTIKKPLKESLIKKLVNFNGNKNNMPYEIISNIDETSSGKSPLSGLLDITP